MTIIGQHYSAWTDSSESFKYRSPSVDDLTVEWSSTVLIHSGRPLTGVAVNIITPRTSMLSSVQYFVFQTVEDM